MNTITVMIVDDHLMVREGLKQLLEIEDDIEVIAEAGSGLECLQLLENSAPDIVFMDIRMPGISGIETTRLITRKYPRIKVIALTIYDDDQYVVDAVRAGAKGYVLKKVERDKLIAIVRQVMENRAFIDPSLTTSLFDRVRRDQSLPATSEKHDLTRRELEVLRALVEGHTDREIAGLLFISEHTVRSHIKNLYRKLGVSSKSRAVAKALHDKIIESS